MKPLDEVGREIAMQLGYYTHAEVNRVGLNRYRIKAQVLTGTNLYHLEYVHLDKKDSSLSLFDSLVDGIVNKFESHV